MDERKIVLYMRLSLEDDNVRTDKKDESNSIEHQREIIRTYLVNHPDLKGEILELKDDGYTGTDLERPHLQEMLNMIYENQVGVVIVKDLSRLGRNYLDVGYLTDLIFPSFGVRLIAVNDYYDSLKEGESTGGIEVALKNIANQFYSIDLSKKSKSAKEVRLSQGKHMGDIPFGYKRGAEKGMLEIDSEAAVIVRMVFQLVKDAPKGVSCAKIARMMNEQHIITPSLYRQKKGNKSVSRAMWTSESVYNILCNITYTGNLVKYRCHKNSVNSKVLTGVPRDEWEIVPDTHEPLVSQELYDEVWAKIPHKKNKTSTHRWRARSSILQGVLRCCYCGAVLQRKTVKPFQYMCSSVFYATKDSKCRTVVCNPDEIEVIVLETLNKLATVATEQSNKAKQEAASLDKQCKALEKKCVQLSKKLADIKAKRQKLFEQLLEGEITQEAFLNDKAGLRMDEQEVMYSMEALQEEQRQIQQHQMEQKKAQSELTVYEPVDKLTKEAVRKFVKRITIYPDRSPEITFNFKDCFTE
jgi:DNA invertase Pin-like site-specific DNA recombinase